MPSERGQSAGLTLTPGMKRLPDTWFTVTATFVSHQKMAIRQHHGAGAISECGVYVREVV